MGANFPKLPAEFRETAHAADPADLSPVTRLDRRGPRAFLCFGLLFSDVRRFVFGGHICRAAARACGAVRSRPRAGRPWAAAHSGLDPLFILASRSYYLIKP